ncbi:MAG TPA: hypothetical protein VFA18_18360, partial [Gemmataceae bacterium]|nr:hypothetical protein [Gemmataceae bacterium]
KRSVSTMADSTSNSNPRQRPYQELAPADYADPVIELYKKDVDRTLLRENLKLTPEERIRKYESFQAFALQMRAAGEHSRSGT